MIQRYLKLLAIVNSPEEILAITFTRKAAYEMQLRIIDALRRAREGVAPEAEYERITFEAATAVLARDREFDWNLIQSPGRMRIQTVDAFGAGIARSLPLSSGLGGISATVSGAEMNAMYREAAAATFDSLDAVLAYRDQWLAMTGSGLSDPKNASTARAQLEKNIEDIVAQELERLRGLFPDACADELLALISYANDNLLQDDKPDHPLCKIAGGTELPGTAATDRLAGSSRVPGSRSRFAGAAIR